MSPLTTRETLSDWIGEPITETVDEKRAEIAVRIASALVREETGRSFVSENGAVEVPETVELVTLMCAARLYENPNAVTDYSIDDSRERSLVEESGAYLTVSEKAQLSSYRARRSGIGAMYVTKGEVPLPTGWVPTDTPGVEFPWY